MTEPQITTRINEETVDLSALEFEIPCEYTNKGVAGDCGQSNPADWLVIKTKPGMCAHDNDLYMCDPCWQKRNLTGTLMCQRCGIYGVPCLSDVARLERIRP